MRIALLSLTVALLNGEIGGQHAGVGSHRSSSTGAQETRVASNPWHAYAVPRFPGAAPNQWVKSPGPVTIDRTAWIMAPGEFVNPHCYDSRRGRIVVTLPRKMQAVDPAGGDTVDLAAKTVIDGEEFPGGPPLQGALTCYDPVNDEILMFSYWTKNMLNVQRGPDPRLRNLDRVDIDGVTSGHFGTLRFSFADTTWRRVGETFGTAEVRAARAALFDLMAKVSRATDAAWVLRRARNAADASQVKSLFAEAAESIGGLPQPEAAKGNVASAAPLIRQAAAAAEAGQWDETLHAGGMALWHLNNVIEQDLRVEPPPRCAAPMVYDPVHKAMVLFGGWDGLVRTDLGRVTGPGVLNDTWVYDCTTRRWREVATDRRPPAQMRPALFYDPESEGVVLVTFEGAGQNKIVRLWSLDLKKGEWSLRAEQELPGPLTYHRGQGSEQPKAYTPIWGVGFDAKQQQVVFSQKDETYVLHLDLAKLPSQPAPEWTPPEPIIPQSVPRDDPAVLAKLKELPANEWVQANPQPDLRHSRAWGNLGCDPVRGWAVYFGGGHATYQINDVAIYAPGANRWARAAGDHNSPVPPNNWDGIAVGFRGGANAQHQRNIYQALDGRMYVDIGGASKETRYGGIPDGTRPGPRYTWFYDVDRGGLWRRQRISEATRVNGADGFWGRATLSSPDGRLFGLGGDQSAGPYVAARPNFYVTIYDANRNTLECRKTAGDDFPVSVAESRPFCFVPDRDQIFYVGASYRAKDKTLRTWVYDVKTNAWTDLQAKDQPEAHAYGCESIDGQNAVWVVTKAGEYIYSFEKNAWRPLGDTKAKIGGPYAQVAYVAKYGVLVSVPHRVLLMRVQVDRLDW